MYVHTQLVTFELLAWDRTGFFLIKLVSKFDFGHFLEKKWMELEFDLVLKLIVTMIYSKVSNKRADLIREQGGIFLKKC